MKYYLAVDIGASSGRHILCHLEQKKFVMEEIHRFPNGAKENEQGVLCWDIKHLFSEIIAGLKKCYAAGKIPTSIGIDTWGVDFVLLDENREIIGDSVCYRDNRTDGITCGISDEELYKRTGIQKQKFNTIYQLMSLKENQLWQLEKAETMLMLPGYFSYLLTGRMMQEYTNATTTGLVCPETKDWDFTLIEQIGLPKKIFKSLSMPGTLVGKLDPKIAGEVGFDANVVLAASHDTASAVLAVPSNKEDIIYISSGTWSLMGVEREKPDCSPESMTRGFTNEGGYGGKVRYLKNIMGLWMIEQLRHELNDKYSFAELCSLAQEQEIDTIVDCGDQSFLAPASMKAAIEDYCERNNLMKPVSVGEFARVIYRSLAFCYKDTARELEEITGKKYCAIHIVGGGSNADYLNKLTAKFTGKTVYAGPSEATACGNIAVQMLADKSFTSVSDVRQAIGESCELKVYK